MRKIILPAVAAVALAGGCVGETGYYSGTVAVSASTPDLLPIGSGVSVIANYGEPIFYTNGFYWWNVDGYWYRSAYYTGGWVSASPPRAVVRIGNPYRYRYYRPHGYVVRRRPVPSQQIRRPVVRDYRSDRDHRPPRRR